MGFTDSLPLSLHLPLISQGSLKSDESTGCLSFPRGSESSNDLRLWTDDAVCIDFYRYPWKQLQNTEYKIQNTEYRWFETCVSHLSRHDLFHIHNCDYPSLSPQKRSVKEKHGSNRFRDHVDILDFIWKRRESPLHANSP